MRKLAFADAAFLYNETIRTPMHIGSVQLMRLPPDKDGAAFTRSLQEQVGTRLNRVPYLTGLLQEAPLQFDHPSFATTANVNLAHHIHRVMVDAPGDLRALELTIARLHEKPLDRSRPLWEMVVIDGLDDGRVAVYSRVHHCCIDGIAGQKATELIYDTAPATSASPVKPAEAESPEHPLIGMIHALENFQHAGDLNLHAMPDMFRAAIKVRERLSGKASTWNGGLGLAPASPFSKPVGRRRTVAFATIPLADLKAVGQQTSTTLNDVILAICGGGLRQYLLRSGNLPKESMLAGCPVSLRRPGDTSLNNQVSMMRVALGTHLANALVRLMYIREASRHARHLTVDAAALLPPVIAAPGLPLAARSLALWNDWIATSDQPLPVPVNVVISNVPGPTVPLFVAGARMESHFPVSIPAHGLPVNLTVQSYDGSMYLGITACARALPDAGILRDDLLQAWTTLRTEALPVTASIHPMAPAAEASTAEPDRQAA